MLLYNATRKPFTPIRSPLTHDNLGPSVPSIMEIVFTRAENACGYERPLDEQLHTVEHRVQKRRGEKEGERRRAEKKERERERKGKCVTCVTFLL